MATVVVGGGISGLTLAYSLLQRGETVRIAEATDRVGGNIGSRLLDGFLTETGPNTFYKEEPDLFSVLEALGLVAKIRTATPAVKKRFLYLDKAICEAPRSPLAVMGWNAFPLSARLRLLAEPFIARGRQKEESVGSFFRRRFGQQMGDVLADVLQMGVYAGDPDALSLVSCFPRLAEMERAHRSLFLALLRQGEKTKRTLCTLEGGLQTLTDALAQQLGGTLSLGTEGLSLERRQGRWRLWAQQEGRNEAWDAETIALALPAYRAAPLVRPLDGALADELEAIAYAPVAAVHFGVRREQVGASLDGFGMLIPESEGRQVMGILYVSSAFPWRAPNGQALFTCMVGGSRHGELCARTDLIPLVWAQLQEILGIRGEPTFASVDRWAQGIPQYELGHKKRLAHIQDRLKALPGLQLLGNAYNGVGLHDCIRAARQVAADFPRPSP